MKDRIKKILYNQTPLKILSFLSVRPGEVFSAKEISRQTRSSTGSTNQALRLFVKLKIVFREKKGNMYLYRLNFSNLVLRQFKIFETILDIEKMIEDIQRYCYQIVLFGSCADGTNSRESDLDLFITSEYKDEVQKRIDKYRTSKYHLQAIVQDPLEIASSKKEDKAFFEQVKKGIVLWEGRPEHEEF